MKTHFLQKEIKWELKTPAASHMGGVWERQIRTFRKVLNVILTGQIVDDERLSTLFCEVESIVSGRPLTVLSDDPNDETPPDTKSFTTSSWRTASGTRPVLPQ